MRRAVKRHEVCWASLQPDDGAGTVEGLAEPPILLRAVPTTTLTAKLAGAAADAPRAAARAWALAQGEPLDAARMRFPAMERLLAGLAARRRFDVIQAEYGAMGVYLPALRKLWPEARVVVDELEVMSVALSRKIEAGDGDPAVARELDRWRRFEPKIWSAADAVSTMSNEEAAVVDRAAGAGKARVVPNGVDVEAFDFRPRRESKTVLFLGNLAHSPNAVGLERFLRDCWPRVAARRPDARLEVVGAGASDALLAHEGGSVRFLGFVDDAAAAMERAALMVVPIISGGGTRLKVLEAMAAGVPVVSTPLGCEGLGAADGEQAVLAEMGPPLADAVVRALERPDELRETARTARLHVESRFAWDSIFAELETVWREGR